MNFPVPFDLVIFLLGTFAAAFVAGLAGFAFGMVAAGIWLFALTPVQTTTLIVAYALLVQGYSTWRLRRTIIPSRLLPFVLGSAIGIPAGIAVLELASAVRLRTAVGLLLIAFGLYNLLRPKMPSLKNVGQAGDAGIGFLNGVLGGSTGLGGILPTLWCVLRGWPRDESSAGNFSIKVSVGTPRWLSARLCLFGQRPASGQVRAQRATCAPPKPSGRARSVDRLSPSPLKHPESRPRN
jgi:uncharacterized membrane protein YfcA